MPTRLFEMIVSSAGELSASGLLLRLALAGCSVFAVIHLLSLWGTRYGDNNTMGKSFFLSLVLHGCACLGWATVVESYPRRPAGTDPEVVQIPITFVESVDEAPQEGTNILPIFQSGVATSDARMARESSSLRRVGRDQEMAEVASPQVDKSPESKVAPDLPDFANQTEEKSPNLEQSSVAAPKSVASISVSIDQPTVESRPALTARTTPSRTGINRPATAADAVPRSDFKTGGSTRVAPFIEDGAVMTLPSEVATDALPKPQGLPNNELIRRQGSPQLSSVIDQNTGLGAERSIVGNSVPRRQERMSRPDLPSVDGQDRLAASSASNSRPSSSNDRTSIANISSDKMLTTRDSVESPNDSPQPNFEKPKTVSMTRAPARAPETYQARSQGQRMSSVLKHGGSDESERAVERSLKWMASVQEPDGRWSSSRHGGGAVDKDPQDQPRLEGGKYADSGTTGLVVLSFLGAGYTHERGPYTSEVRKALDWLISQQLPNGYLGGKATRYHQNYCHAIATFALAEAYAMQKEAGDYSDLRTAVKRGVKMIAAMQNEDGGWRYGRGGESDMSMFGWQLMALKSAVNAGIPVPEETRRGMVTFLDARARGLHGGLAGYKKDDKPTPAMTAEALFCRQMFSTRTNDAASQEAVAYLRRNLPRVTAYDEYFWYYGTLAMHQVDDESWQEWNNALRDMLISLQRQDGLLAGSWDPRGKWAGIGGRLYSTALSTMCLEVYYRYQSNAKSSDNP